MIMVKVDVYSDKIVFYAEKTLCVWGEGHPGNIMKLEGIDTIKIV